eukprot:754734_1
MLSLLLGAHIMMVSLCQAFTVWNAKLPSKMIYFGYVINNGALTVFNGQSNVSNSITSSYVLDIYKNPQQKWTEAAITNMPFNATKIYYMGQSFVQFTYPDDIITFAVGVHPMIIPNGNVQYQGLFEYTPNEYLKTSSYQYITPYPSINPCIVYNQQSIIFIIGGDDGNGLYQGETVLYYQKINEFFLGGNLNVNRSAAGCASDYSNANADIYIFGGKTNSDGTATDMIEKYSMTTKKWEIISVRMPFAVRHLSCVRYFDTGVTADYNIYCIGGIIDGKVSDAVQIFNPRTSKFIITEKINVARANAVVGFWNTNCLFVMG